MTIRARPASSPAMSGSGVAAACCSCGDRASTAAETDDLATVWLVPGPDTGPVARRFCRRCAPPGPVDEVACARCGDGPLLAGELTAMDLEVSAAVDAWLADTGWRLAGPVCLECVCELSR